MSSLYAIRIKKRKKKQESEDIKNWLKKEKPDYVHNNNNYLDCPASGMCLAMPAKRR
jgi:hypothetical protein